MTAPTMTGFPVTVSFRMHWSEMDALGHANNARFFTWFESARLACFERLVEGISLGPKVGPILAHTSCDFLRPLVYPADLISGARVEKVGHTSLTIGHAVARAGQPDDHFARGTAIMVLVNYETGEKIPLPAELRQAVALLGA